MFLLKYMFLAFLIVSPDLGLARDFTREQLDLGVENLLFLLSEREKSLNQTLERKQNALDTGIDAWIREEEEEAKKIQKAQTWSMEEKAKWKAAGREEIWKKSVRSNWQNAGEPVKRRAHASIRSIKAKKIAINELKEKIKKSDGLSEAAINQLAMEVAQAYQENEIQLQIEKMAEKFVFSDGQWMDENFAKPKTIPYSPSRQEKAARQKELQSRFSENGSDARAVIENGVVNVIPPTVERLNNALTGKASSIEAKTYQGSGSKPEQVINSAGIQGGPTSIDEGYGNVAGAESEVGR